MTDEETLDERVDEAADPATDIEEEQEEKSLEEQLKEAIDVRVEEVGGLRKKLTITVPHDTLAQRLDGQFGELRRDAVVPGFRKGRAPRRLLEKRFGGEVKETLVQQVLSTGYLAAVDKIDLKVIGDPLIWVKEEQGEGETLVDVQEALEVIELPDDEPLVFSCEVEVRPEFELPETEGIAITRPVVAVTDEDIDVQIDRIRMARGTYETLVDGTVEPDDVVLADVKMSSGETALKQQEGVRVAARPQHIDGVPLDKLGEVLTGAKAGDLRAVSGQISDDYIKAEFRGKQADFEIKIREIQRLRMPELNDAFFQNLGFDAPQELREWVKSDLESRLGEQTRQGMVAQVYQYLLDNTSVELPERLSERQTDRVMARRMLELYRQGVPPAETEKLLDEMKTSAKEQSARDLKLFFVMEKLADEFEVEVGEGEINGLIAAIAQRQGRRFDRVRDELAKEGGLANLYVQIRDEKIVDRLLEKARITESKPPQPRTGKKSTGKSKSSAKTSSDGPDTDVEQSADET